VKTVTIKCALPEYENDLCDIIRLFFGDCAFLHEDGGEITVVHAMNEKQHILSVNGIVETAPLTQVSEDPLETKRALKRAIKNALYDALILLTGKHIPWGSLTGIRPTRLYDRQIKKGMTEDEVVHYLHDTYHVDTDKAILLRDIARQQATVEFPKPGEIDVYAGIPFCRTRCSYCSFAAVDLKHGQKWTEDYVTAICKEMKLVQDDLAKYKVRGLYIGGGTPTALSCGQLQRVIECALDCYPGAQEFTVEAGRPDTIDAEKLKMLQDHGVNRISLNPQTMCDKTLKAVGRDHTAQDIIRVYHELRDMNFAVINMDLIMGLPGETVDDVRYTLDEVSKLAPDNLTVHTLAIKRAAELRQTGYTADDGAAMQMVALGKETAENMGLHPYYLYRQKYMADNLENVGYCKPGTVSIYNVDIMEEIAPIVAFGAGAISKWLYPAAKHIDRAPNIKNIEQYIARVEEMAQRKRTLWEEKA